MLTAKQVRESTFSRSARGYRVDEIDEYLENVADTIENLTEQNNTLIKKMEILASKVQEYREEEDSIRAALVTAQRSADSIVKEAKSSVEGQLAEAREKADKIIADSKSEADSTLAGAKEQAERLVDETKKRASSVLLEAKEKADSMVSEAKEQADRMLTEAKEGSAAEIEKFEQMKKKSLEFRSALLQLYKEQFDIIKNGKFIHQKSEESDADKAESGDKPKEKELPFDPAAQSPKDEGIKAAEAENKDGGEILTANQENDQSVSKPGFGNAEAAGGQSGEVNQPDLQTGEISVKEDSNGISDGFKIDNPPVSSKFQNLKFGDDYDISQDTDGDGKKPSGFFGRRKK